MPPTTAAAGDSHCRRCSRSLAAPRCDKTAAARRRGHAWTEGRLGLLVFAALQLLWTLAARGAHLPQPPQLPQQISRHRPQQQQQQPPSVYHSAAHGPQPAAADRGSAFIEEKPQPAMTCNCLLGCQHVHIDNMKHTVSSQRLPAGPVDSSEEGTGSAITQLAITGPAIVHFTAFNMKAPNASGVCDEVNEYLAVDGHRLCGRQIPQDIPLPTFDEFTVVWHTDDNKQSGQKQGVYRFEIRPFTGVEPRNSPTGGSVNAPSKSGGGMRARAAEEDTLDIKPPATAGKEEGREERDAKDRHMAIVLGVVGGLGLLVFGCGAIFWWQCRKCEKQTDEEDDLAKKYIKDADLPPPSPPPPPAEEIYEAPRLRGHKDY